MHLKLVCDIYSEKSVSNQILIYSLVKIILRDRNIPIRIFTYTSNFVVSISF